jgi:excisionase family DNA binding protein
MEKFPVKRFYTPDEVAKYFEGNLAPGTIREMCRRGEIPGARLLGKKKWLIPYSYLFGEAEAGMEKFPVKRFYTPKEVSEYFEGNLTLGTIWEMCRDGQIPGARMFGKKKWLIPRSYLIGEEEEKKETQEP